MAIDTARLQEFMGKAVGDLGAAISVPLFILGERLGLYRAMAGAGAMTPAHLAKKAGTDERCTREWLLNQAAGGYVTYHARNPTRSPCPMSRRWRWRTMPARSFSMGRTTSFNHSFATCQSLSKCFAAARGWAGASMMDACSPARPDSFGRIMSATSSPIGFPRLDGARRAPRRRGTGGGCRLRVWVFHDAHGRGIPAIAVCRIRYPWPVRRVGTENGRRKEADQLSIRGRLGVKFPRPRLRPGHLLRLPA